MNLNFRTQLYPVLFIMISVFFIGISQISFLPPWEGFDEPAHWSSIQQIADTGTIPRYGDARIAADFDAYSGPVPYGIADPAQASTRPTYRGFHDAGSPALTTPLSRHFQPSNALNWEAQHPPLYYILLTPIYLLTEHLPWPEHLFALRTFSWLMAFAGFAIGVIGTIRLLPPAYSGAPAVMALYPFVFPQFFPEMARIGNDSLCLLLLGIGWVLLLGLLTGDRRRNAAWLGGVLGAGMLTKAFFLPVAAGVGALLLVRWYQAPSRARASDILVFGGVAAVIGLPWYIHNFLVLGDIIGSNDFIHLRKAGGLAAGLSANFDLSIFAKGIAGIIWGFFWAGTWSLAQSTIAMIVLPMAVALLAFAGWYRTVKERPDLASLVILSPVFLLLPVMGGLLYHVVSSIAVYGYSVTPGWYLHIFAAPIGFMIALGWRWPRLQRWLALGAAVSGVAGWAFQLSLFSGCATKNGSTHRLDLTGADCGIDWHQLGVLGFPTLGVLCLAAAALMVLYAAAHYRRLESQHCAPASEAA